MHWPELSAEKDGETFAKLHLVSQMLGKMKVAHSPWVNHGWHIALQPVPEGLATLPITADGRRFTLTLDLCRHATVLQTDNGTRDDVSLHSGTIADHHRALVRMLDRHGLPSKFHGTPNEVENPVPFAKDDAPRGYEEDSAMRLRQALSAMLPVFDHYRAGFAGKSSPVHFFWGSFDLAVTRFSGRDAPEHPGGLPNLPDSITREAYSHEVASAGFWAGGVVPADPIFYAYAYPEPKGYRGEELSHGGWSDELSEWVLSYDEVRQADDPAKMLGTFLEETYRVAARTAQWDRDALERVPVRP
ncbi:DUF5996 family protein [Sphingomicrobium sediminis]|uniref:DUF5996 family protein n=1 Tax=Sphingomicrobium sediminis TaxID=2950949 RepID=A0A9X2EJR6_9SPHN|nr:DUF5996 family protein [Sphingomicrobium sediminis]MCM8558106.1 DUF5996 family protein [Sphingomicrobium sediminis]